MPFDEEESNSVATSSFLSPVTGVREEFRVRVEVLSNGVLWMNLGLVLGLSYFQIGVMHEFRVRVKVELLSNRGYG